MRGLKKGPKNDPKKWPTPLGEPFLGQNGLKMALKMAIFRSFLAILGLIQGLQACKMAKNRYF